MIKTVIFDLGQVIIPFDMERGYAALQPHCSYPADEMRKRISAAGIVGPFETGRMEPQEFVQRFTAAIGMSIPYDRFCELWSSIFLPHSPVPESMLEGLARRYRVLALSNTNAIHFEMIKRTYPILRHFHGFVLSHEVGAAKPDPRIYEAALKQAGCRPEECFFTDDMPVFVEAARKFGIDAVVFESAAQIERELAARGVCWH